MKSILLSILAVIPLAARSAKAESSREAVQPLKLWKDVGSSELKDFKAPVAERFQLPNGMVVFLLEDHELPLIELSMILKVGEIHEPPEMAGLAAATANVMRAGGSARYPGDKLDETLENMAAEFNIGIGQESGSATLKTLKEDFDKGLAILADVLRNPEFPDEKLALVLEQARAAIAKRNDSAGNIASREFKKALYGERSPYAKVVEYENLFRINRQAMLDFHQQYFHPNLFITGVIGDFKKEEMLEKLKSAFGGWQNQPVRLPEVERISTSRKRKTCFVERPKINQTTFSMGHVIDLRRDSKDYPATLLLSEILGGHMHSRLFTEVRTRKGLAYAVHGFAQVYYDRPGFFYCSTVTRNEQALEALNADREELLRMRERGITESELAEGREFLINSYVFNFDSPGKIIGRQMTYEFYGYPMDFAEKLLEAVKRVTVEDVNRAAKQYLDPDKMVLVGVGNSAGLDPARTFLALKEIQLLDVTIPIPKSELMVVDPAREKEGRRILNECLKAAGGVDAFKNIRTLRAEVQIASYGFKLKGCMQALLPDKVRVDVAGPFGAVSQIVNGDAAWKASGNSIEELKPSDARKNLRTLLQSDLGLMRVLANPNAKEDYNVQALEPSRQDGQELAGVEIESQSLGRIKIWFDAKTYLMARIRYVNGAQKEYDKLFSGHEKYGDLILARTINDKDPSGTQHIELQSLAVNPSFAPELFDKPERATPPPEDGGR